MGSSRRRRKKTLYRRERERERERPAPPLLLLRLSLSLHKRKLSKRVPKYNDDDDVSTRRDKKNERKKTTKERKRGLHVCVSCVDSSLQFRVFYSTSFFDECLFRVTEAVFFFLFSLFFIFFVFGVFFSQVFCSPTGGVNKSRLRFVNEKHTPLKRASYSIH